jgi:hypothetical protein
MGHTLQLGDAKVDEKKLADLCRQAKAAKEKV